MSNSHNFFLDLAKETQQICKDQEYITSDCEVFTLLPLPFYPLPQKLEKGFILFEGDMLDAAQQTGIGNVLIFASHRRPGGGWENGKTSQEESFYYRTDLSRYGLKRDNEFYTKDQGEKPRQVAGISVFRDSSYSLCEPWLCDFIYLAAPVVTPDSDPKVVQTRIRKQIQALADLCVTRRHVVIGPWGCGVYGNDPRFVASVFKETFEPLFKASKMDHVVVCLQDDENGKIFKEVFGWK